MKLFYDFSLGFFFLLLIASCKIVAPKSPAITVGEYKAPAQEVSTMTIPVEMEMKSYFKDADNAVPSEFKGEEQNCDGVSYSYTFKRNPIKIEGNSKKTDPLQVGIEVEGKYAIKLNYCVKCSDFFTDKPVCLSPRIYASCGIDEPMRRIKIDFETEIGMKPNFQLDSKTKLKEIKAIDRCEISVFKYDATSHLLKEVRGALKDLEKEIDKEVEALDVKTYINEIWETFTKPFDLDGFGFMFVNPTKIGMNNLSLSGTKLKFNALLEAYPIVRLHNDNQVAPKLPNLSKIEGKEGFNINLDLVANYDSLSAILNREIQGKEFAVKRNRIIISSAKIYGAANQKLNIEVVFTGKKSGKMYFTGMPSFVDSTQEVSFPDLTFELETKNTLLKSAKWLFNDKITSMMRSYAKFNFKSVIQEATKTIDERLNQEIQQKVVLAGQIKEVKVKSIFPDKEKLVIQTNLQGILNVLIK